MKEKVKGKLSRFRSSEQEQEPELEINEQTATSRLKNMIQKSHSSSHGKYFLS